MRAHGPNGTDYDVIIVGASFAGLAAASRLSGRVLLIDRKGIGEGQTSACLTPLSLVLDLAGPGAVLQTHAEGWYLHVGDACVRYPLPAPVCTFDYRAFCRAFFGRTGARFLQAVALGVEDGAVVTDRGVFTAEIVVDASGWRAALANPLVSAFQGRESLAFAMETEVEQAGEDLHIWLDGATRTGYQWAFPAGRFTRIGIGTYAETNGLKQRLGALTRHLGAGAGAMHGGFLSYGLHDPVAGGVFAIGDAAGQCLPFTGEGVRPAVYFGQRCGDLLQQALDGAISHAEAAREYRRLVNTHRPQYVFLAGLQGRVKRVPLFGLKLLARRLASTPLAGRLLAAYLERFPLLPSRPAVNGGVAASEPDCGLRQGAEPAAPGSQPLLTPASGQPHR